MENLRIGDTIVHKVCKDLRGTIVEISDEYVWYDCVDGTKHQPIHISNINNYKKK